MLALVRFLEALGLLVRSTLRVTDPSHVREVDSQ